MGGDASERRCCCEFRDTHILLVFHIFLVCYTVGVRLRHCDTGRHGIASRQEYKASSLLFSAHSDGIDIVC